MRIACVQYGDYTEAKRLRDSGRPETYNQQRYTLEHFERFVSGSEYMVVSLHASEHLIQEGPATLAGLNASRRSRFIPRRLSEWLQTRRVIRLLEQFGPTHLLLRCNDVIGCELLRWAAQNIIPAAAVIAARFDPAHPACRQFCEVARRSECITLVANHNRVASESMIDCGLPREKLVAWDMPPTVSPDLYTPKGLRAASTRRLLYAGSVLEAKGVGDLVVAVERLLELGHDVRLDICGDGPLLPSLKAHCGIMRGRLGLHGLVGQQEVVRLMREADFVVVPSRPAFPEGLPFVIQESLAVRTPLLLSDHPVFTRYFSDAVATRFFRAGDIGSLAAALIDAVETDALTYQHMSTETAAAWDTIRCQTTWHEVLEQLALTWGLPSATKQHDDADVFSYSV
jgi:glycosyltransferase involved in cell wall biosynthesis